jgi:hypothetical protein
LSSKASPYVRYFIQDVEYTIATNTTSVTYEMWAEYPDGDRVDKKIDYIGATEDQTIYTAASYNDAKNTLAPSYPEIDPADNTSTGKFDNGEAETVTVFTVIFPEGTLIPNKYKLDFPDGTVQAEGCNANLNDELWNKFNVVSAIDFDATSSEEDYNEPSVYPKDKVYNISTSTKEITLYLTGENLWSHGNANSRVVLLEGTELLLDGEEGEVTWENATEGVDGIYTVTLPERSKNGGLEPGTYKLSIPDMKIYSRDALEMMKDSEKESNSVAKDVYNKELTPDDPLYSTLYPKFTLTINVEDFAADKAIEITTKQYAFEVTVPGLTEVLVPTASFDDGTAATLSKVKDGVMLVTIGGAKPLVKGAEHNFLHSGDYVLTIPAGAFKGQYATSYEDIDVDVKVIFEFADYGIEEESYPEYKDLTTTTEDEVLDEKGDHIKMYFSRQFKTTNYQGLAVPFDLTQEEVKDYFTIYRIQTVTVADNGDFKLNFVTVGEDGTAYANKPYVIKPVAAGLVQIELLNVEEPKYVEEPEVADDVWAATTMVKFDFFNTIGAKEFTEPVGILGTQDGVLGFSVDNYACSPWRWYMTSSDKKIKYIKIAINGVDVDDATAIDFVEALEGNTQIFNVAGQRLNAPAKGKVNIINGKKVLVK